MPSPTSQRFCQCSLVALSLSLLAAPGQLQAAGTPGAGEETIAEGRTADQVAHEHYQKGLTHKLAAREKQASAEAADGAAERLRLHEEAQLEYRQAIRAQGKALKLQLNYYQAANELGYALRQTGDYRKALGAYNFALQIKPDFYPAVEYRGEAYLALGMIEKAKQAYMTLFRNNPTLAAQLLERMAAAAQTGSGAFQAWVVERTRLAALTTAGKVESNW